MKWSPDLITGSSWEGKQPGGCRLIWCRGFKFQFECCVLYNLFPFHFGRVIFLKRSWRRRRSAISSSFPLHRRLSAGGHLRGASRFPSSSSPRLLNLSWKSLATSRRSYFSSWDCSPSRGRAALIKLSLSRDKYKEHNQFPLFIHVFVCLCTWMFCRVILCCRPVSDLWMQMFSMTFSDTKQ